jgi:DNA-binding response OmpR family regulator
VKNKKHILSISYDESLLETRARLLQNAGFQVTSTIGFADAQTVCGKNKYDLIVICHTVPRSDKTLLAKSIRGSECGQILSLRKHENPPMEEAQWSVDSSTGPEVLLRTVTDILGTPRR